MQSHSDTLTKRIWQRLQEHLSAAAVGGAVITLTGFAPDHWVAKAFQFLQVPESVLPSWRGGFDARILIVALGVAIIVGDVLLRQRRYRRSILTFQATSGTQTATHVSSPPKTSARAAIKIDSDKAANNPSLVVLPFANMSGDPEQDFFADGMTEEIITELSRFRHLFVISRHSAFKFKGKDADVRQVARDLGVQYVVEGSVRKADKRVRVTVQLIDGESDRHIWAERYDRQLEDIFCIQDEVASAIVATLPGRVEAATRDRCARKPTDNLAAYECVLTGKLLHHRSTRPDNEAALRMLDRAIALDPNYAHAHAWRACVLAQACVYGFCKDREETWRQVASEGETALQLDNNDSDVHRILAAVYLASDQHEKALFHQERALSLNPNDDLIVVQQGELLTWLGRADEGIQWIEKAMRLNPYHPERFWNHLGRAFFVAQRYTDAVAAFGHIHAPDYLQYALLAACYSELGNYALAHSHAMEVLKREPSFSVQTYMRTLHYRSDEDAQRHRQALLKAGLPLSDVGSAAARPAGESTAAIKPTG